MRRAAVILAVDIAVACQTGEVVNARWTDDTWRRATIVDVRERGDGVCGQYKLVWHHNHICEDPTITGHDTTVSMNFCIVSRDAIQACKQELCRWGDTVETEKLKSSGTGADEEDKRHVALIVALVCISLACCCIFLRFCVQQCYVPYEDDEERGRDTVTPCGTSRSLKSGRSFWNLTPKSATSSPMAKWLNKPRRAAGLSNQDKKIIVQPEPIAAVPPAKNQNVELQPVEQKHVQPEKGASRHGPFCPATMPQTHGSALRQAAWSYGGPSVPSRQSMRPPVQLPTVLQQREVGPSAPSRQSIRPPLQLPTLLQQREGLTNPPPRKKPPLQGVPPQGKSSQQASSRKVPTSYEARSQGPYFV